jgi:hypothetical protein
LEDRAARPAIVADGRVRVPNPLRYPAQQRCQGGGTAETRLNRTPNAGAVCPACRFARLIGYDGGMTPLQKMLRLLRRLDDSHLPYKLDTLTSKAPTVVVVNKPKERWEIACSLDGRMEVERFSRDGKSLGTEAEEAIGRLFSELD